MVNVGKYTTHGAFGIHWVSASCFPYQTGWDALDLGCCYASFPWRSTSPWKTGGAFNREYPPEKRGKLYGCFRNGGFSPQIIHFNRVSHYFHHPLWGTPNLWNHPYLSCKIASVIVLSWYFSHPSSFHLFFFEDEGDSWKFPCVLLDCCCQEQDAGPCVNRAKSG